jgi:transcriptional regulator with XRE-family HTH domain
MSLTKAELAQSVGLIIRDVRMSKRLTIEQLALESGIEYSQLSRIERGKINTSIYHIYLIVTTLKIPLRLLIKHTLIYIYKGSFNNKQSI